MQGMKAEARVRRATQGDIPAIRSVLAITWRDTYAAFVSLEAIERTTAAWHAPQVLAAEVANPAVFTGVAEDASGVVGMVSAHDRDGRVEIARLYVLPTVQRRGIGGRLLAAALEAFPARALARLGVEEQNPKGRSFYGKQGFVAVGEQEIDAFGTSLRLIVMERRMGSVDQATE